MKDFGFLGGKEQGTQFGFSSGCCNKFEYCACNVDCTIKFDWVASYWKTTKEEMATSVTAGSLGREIQCIGKDVVYHVGGTVSDEGIWMSPHVVEESADLFHGVLGRC
jgi:hypothetical protein